MTYTFNPPSGEIIDDDGQVVATLSDNALPEQGEALVRAYNSDNGRLEACPKRFFCNFGHLCSYEDREEAQKLLSHSPGPTT